MVLCELVCAHAWRASYNSLPPDPLPPLLQVIIIDRPTGREREQSIWQQGLHQVSRPPSATVHHVGLHLF